MLLPTYESSIDIANDDYFNKPSFILNSTKLPLKRHYPTICLTYFLSRSSIGILAIRVSSMIKANPFFFKPTSDAGNEYTYGYTNILVSSSSSFSRWHPASRSFLNNCTFLSKFFSFDKFRWQQP